MSPKFVTPGMGWVVAGALRREDTSPAEGPQKDQRCPASGGRAAASQYDPYGSLKMGDIL